MRPLCQTVAACVRRSLPVLLLGALLLPACEITGPDVVPEQSVNETTAVEAEIGDFHTNDCVAGMIHLTLPANLQTFEIRRVAVLVDTLVITSIYDPPFSTSVDTRNFPSGSHLVALAVYERQPTLGMHNLLDMPRLVCGTTVAFDQTPPSKVEGLRISCDGSTVIQWNQTTSPAFKAYLVGASITSNYFPNTYNYRDTITSRTTTTWRINTAAVPPGATVGVSITVNNGAQLGPFNTLSGVVGTPIPVASPILRFWNHPTRSESYAWSQDGRMYVLTAKGDSVLRSSGILGSGDVIFSQNGSRFSMFSPGARTITAYSTDDFSPFLPSITLPNDVTVYSTAVLSPNGRFYVANADGAIWAIDQSTGTVVGTTTLAYGTWYGPQMAVSRDSAYLYCTDRMNGISKVNIRNAVPVVESRVDMGNLIYALGFSPDGQYLIATHYGGASVYLLNPGDLTIAADLPLPGPPCSREYYGLDSFSKAFFCEGTSLYVASQYRYVVQFDLISRAVVGRWCVINDPKCMGTARDGRSVLLGFLGDVPSQNMLLAK